MEYLGNYWDTLINNEISFNQFLRWGYYSLPFILANGTEVPNTKILMVNSNACYNLNWDLFGDLDDPGD